MYCFMKCTGKDTKVNPIHRDVANLPYKMDQKIGSRLKFKFHNQRLSFCNGKNSNFRQLIWMTIT